jgi:hypothetical protein
MSTRISRLPLAVLGGVFLLLQVLAVGLGPGLSVCLNPVCAVAVSVVVDDCCANDGDRERLETPCEQTCACTWLPITNEALTVPLGNDTAPVLVTVQPAVVVMLPSTPVRQRVWPATAFRSSSHLRAQRTVVLTC